MTPKEKAQELYIKYHSMNESFNHYDFRQQSLVSHTKQCALVAVDEILKLVSDDLDLYYKDCIYWEQVKAEIELL
jgi:hypothetical protein